MLASALSGRVLTVAEVEAGEPAWTDGKTVFIDPSSGVSRQLAAVAVQACLLSAGSLEPDLVRRLNRRRALAARSSLKWALYTMTLMCRQLVRRQPA